MIRLVLDTNVFISGILTPQSPPAQILDSISEGHFRLIGSNPIITEVKEVFCYPKLTKFLKKRDISQKQAADAFNKLIKLAVVVPGKLKIRAIEQDPSDNMFISAAIEGRADFIISGDHHLTDLKSYAGIRIMDPTTFLKTIQNES